MARQHVYVICGAAGSGKTTVARYLRQHFQMHRVITHTTRAPRPGERNGVDYHFETPTSMAHLHLLESVTYDRAQYGSSMEGLAEGWRQGHDDVIVLDTKGALTYRRALGDRVTVIFLTVSHLATLAQRMSRRGDEPAAITGRLNSPEYHRDLHLPHPLRGVAKVIVNDDWEATKRTLEQLVNRNQ
ncbi:guanylate kinase [Limosilactobacillus sp.]|uniref:guanylate kinase n=1 Tax=Limosilactobacillus sp. TaxID=2773925 RepID=UPI003EFF09E1